MKKEIEQLKNVEALKSNSPDAALFELERNLLDVEMRIKITKRDFLEWMKRIFDWDESKDGPLMDYTRQQPKDEIVKCLGNTIAFQVRWKMMREKISDSEIPPELKALESEEEYLEAQEKKLKRLMIETPSKTIEGVLMKQRWNQKRPFADLSSGEPSLGDSILADLEALTARTPFARVP